MVPGVNRAYNCRAQHADKNDLQGMEIDRWVIGQKFGGCVHLKRLSVSGSNEMQPLHRERGQTYDAPTGLS